MILFLNVLPKCYLLSLSYCAYIHPLGHHILMINACISNHLITGDSLLLYQAREERPIPLLFRLCFRDHHSGFKILAKEQT